MESSATPPLPSPASLRWSILRRALISRSSADSQVHFSRKTTNQISRKATGSFKLIRYQALSNGNLQEGFNAPFKINSLLGPRDVCVLHWLPADRAPQLILIERIEDSIDLKDFDVSTKYKIDTTGLVCRWPSEEVLAYFCIKNPEMFRSKRVLELGSGYGLAGLSIAACTDAHEVVLSDGNPEVINYIKRSISFNATAFGNTQVKPLKLHWSEVQDPDMHDSFDIIIASDCTFFKEYHDDLARSIKLFLKHSEVSEAILFSPKRGDSLDKFLEKIKDIGLQFELVENYDAEVWNLHQKFLSGHDASWPNYEKDHCYPLLVKVTF